MKRKMSENSLKNLEKRKSFSKDNVEFALKAQEKSVAKRKENRTFKEICEIIAKMPDKETGKTNEEAAVVAMFERAKKGDVSAFATIRDTMGQKPTDKQILEASGFSVVINNKARDVKRD